MILLVDLDTQKGEPSEHEALRVAGNLLNAGWRVCAAGDDQKDWDWHARAHGLQGGQRRVCAAALDDRRGSRAASQPVALSSRVRAVSLAPQTRGLICLLKGRRTAGIP